MGKLLFQFCTELAEGIVEDETDVADGESGDFGNLLVGAVVLKFEFEYILVIGRESLDQGPDLIGEFLDIGLITRLGLIIRDPFQGFVIVELKPLFFSQDIEGAVATDGEKPSFEILPHLGRVCFAELEQGVLHHIARPFDIPVEDVGGVTDEGAFMFLQRTFDQQMGF